MFKKFNFKSKSGMTLVEMLIGIAVSAIIMISTITLVDYCFSAYSSTQDQIVNDAGLYDTTDIINKYIREAEFCSLKKTDDGKNNILYMSISGYSVGLSTLDSVEARFLFDKDSQTLLLDRMDGSQPLVIANYVTDVVWEVAYNGVRYKITQKNITSSNPTEINGFSYCRGR